MERSIPDALRDGVRGSVLCGSSEDESKQSAYPVPEQVRPIIEDWRLVCNDSSPEALKFPTENSSAMCAFVFEEVRIDLLPRHHLRRRVPGLPVQPGSNQRPVLYGSQSVRLPQVVKSQNHG